MKVKEILKKNIFYICVVIFIFFLDRSSKYLILDFFNEFPEQNIIINSFLSFNLLWNDGIAFGLFQAEESNIYNIITLLIFVILCIVTWLATKSDDLERICYLIIVGGGLGNIFDRLYFGSVIDFIDISYKNFHWFIFNVADIFITLGVLILLFLELTKKKND